MNPLIIFWIVFSALLLLIIYLSLRHGLLNDSSMLTNKIPYSYARTQLAWWTLIVLSSFISIVLTGSHEIPVFHASTIVLLGISAGTLATARIMDISAQKSANAAGVVTIQNQSSEGFLRDILSDQNGISIHRLQSLIFNLVFGCWFIAYVLKHLGESDRSQIMPVIAEYNLVLIGLSAGAYVALKTAENKQ